MKKLHLKLAGAFGHYDGLLPLVAKHKRMFDFTVYDGVNHCRWNGGRVNRNIQETEKQKKAYDALGVGIAFAFSNPTIEDVNDPVGNDLLERYHDSKNSIILSNYKLLEHIRTKYPLYQCIYSITGHPALVRNPSAYYARLEKDFDIIVPKLEHNMIIEEYTDNVSMYELLINDDCLYDCPLWKKHFDKISHQNTLGARYEDDIEKYYKIEECWLPKEKFDPDIGDTAARERLGHKFGMSLTPTQLNDRIDRGIYMFKISGREICLEDMFMRNMVDFITRVKQGDE